MNAPFSNALDTRIVAELLHEHPCPLGKPTQDIIATVRAAVISEWHTVSGNDVRVGALAASLLPAVTIAPLAMAEQQSGLRIGTKFEGSS